MYLEHKVVLSLELQVHYCLPNQRFEVEISPPGDIQGREEVPDQAHEHWYVIGHDLGDVEISQGAHQDLVLGAVRVPSLQGSCHHQHRLDGPQAPVVVILREGGIGQAGLLGCRKPYARAGVYKIIGRSLLRPRWRKEPMTRKIVVVTDPSSWSNVSYFSSCDNKADPEHTGGWGPGKAPRTTSRPVWLLLACSESGRVSRRKPC